MERERGYSRHKRYTKRLEVTFSSGGLSYRGILSNFSINGLFIRTNRGFAPNTILNIEILLPDGRISYLKGIVRRTIKTPMLTQKNGMGIELIEKDPTYIQFFQDHSEDGETSESSQNIELRATEPEYQIIICPNCNIKNKVLTSKLSLGPKCGKCGIPLNISNS
ncbi:MAG: PilZ domain-containing protein [Nitrospirae bacterium]|nr:PilZ domain-containing protein [Nitrospirota bacterium]